MTESIKHYKDEPIDLPSDHEHEWKLTEDGYTRTWSTEIREDGTIAAFYGGSEDWSENGNGTMYLECVSCGAINDDFDYDKIDYQ